MMRAMKWSGRVAGCLVVAVATRAAPPAAIEPPKTSDESMRVSPFAAEPDIVTPIGATVDAKGRLLVVESHSHFRPKNYAGPATDRIRLFTDSTGSGHADGIATWYEGENGLMNLTAEKDGAVLVASRNAIFRLGAGDEKAGAKTVLAHLETTADYPHNGLHGLTEDAAGNVYFGIGENFGQPWTLVGSDGAKLSDDKGAGSIFRVDHEGKGLVKIARGFWNPFGLGVGPNGTIWAVDNDPDGRPPCRLIDIAPGADYGFEFRYGRTGMHPLQAWDAELPGTLGMVAGVGEAPCAVLWYRGRMVVSSWRDHQVQAFELKPKGATFTATMQPILTGGSDFRPVGLAIGKDGSLFVTDWASNSYPVHGKGRIWKVTFARPAPAGQGPAMNEAMSRAAKLRESQDVGALIAALDDADPAIAQAAQYGLSRLPAVEQTDWSTLKTPGQKIGLLAALLDRGTDVKPYATVALEDPDDSVRQMAVRCVTEQNVTSAKEDLEKLLKSQSLSPRLLGMTVAAISQLNGDKAAKVDAGKINGVLLSRLSDLKVSDAAKATALHMLLMNHPKIPIDQLATLAKSAVPALQLEAVTYLCDDNDPARFPVLAEIATDSRRPANVRAQAVDGLADDAANQTDLLIKLAGDSDAAVRQEALRSLRPVGPRLTKKQKDLLAKDAQSHPAEMDLVHKLLGDAPPQRPEATDVEAWQKLLDQGIGDPEAGRRIFFHPSGPGCFHCHTVEARGRAIGPDLTMIGHSQTRDHVLESILDPSKEIAPLFTLWTIKTKQGQTIDGMLLRRDGQSNEVYVDSAGQEIKVKEPDVVDRKIRKESVMPTGLVDGMTDQELRDVIALLTQKR